MPGYVVWIVVISVAYCVSGALLWHARTSHLKEKNAKKLEDYTEADLARIGVRMYPPEPVPEPEPEPDPTEGFSPWVLDIVKSIKDSPEEWMNDNCTFRNGNVQVWTENGALQGPEHKCLRLWRPVEMEIPNVEERRYLAEAILEWLTQYTRGKVSESIYSDLIKSNSEENLLHVLKFAGTE